MRLRKCAEALSCARDSVNFYILTMSTQVKREDNSIINFYAFNDGDIEKMKKIVKYLDPLSNIVFLDVESYYNQYLKNSINNTTGFTPYAGLRLILDKVLPFIDDVLYFDCDVAVRKNIEEMYESCLKGCCNQG